MSAYPRQERTLARTKQFRISSVAGAVDREGELFLITSRPSTEPHRSRNGSNDCARVKARNDLRREASGADRTPGVSYIIAAESTTPVRRVIGVIGPPRPSTTRSPKMVLNDPPKAPARHTRT